MWEELGISETMDLKAIRKAYAMRLKALKRTPDDQAFARLHSAYQAAIAVAGRKAPAGEAPTTASEIIFLKPAPPPAAPPMVDDEALQTLGANMDALLEAGQFQEAIGVYDQGMARGILPLGDANPYLERIMDKAITTLPPVPFIALARQVGWDTAPRERRITPTRQAVARRLEAERWYQNLEREAVRASTPAVKGVNPLQRLVLAIEQKGRQRNARLLLIDKPQMVRYRVATVKDLQGKIAFYEHYKSGLGSRFPERAIGRAQRMLDFDTKWGKALRRASGWLMVLAIVFSIGGVWGADTAAKAFYVAAIIGWILIGLRALYRRLKNFRPTWAAWLSGQGARLFVSAAGLLIFGVAFLKLINWIEGGKDSIFGGPFPWVLLGFFFVTVLSDIKKRKRW